MITIINYNSGNIASVKNALKKLNVPYNISSRIKEIETAKKIIFPGVGNAVQAMRQIKKLNLINVIRNFKRPFLGICLGMQLMFDFSEEGNTKCLGIIKGKVRRFPNLVKVPHIGWNKLAVRSKPRELYTLKNNDFFYFIHSYYCDPENKKLVVGKTNYGISFCSAIKKGNFYGVQFHPEKSAETGLKLLDNFCRC